LKVHEAVRNDLVEQMKACTLCAELAEKRTNVVVGDGSWEADVVFCGEAPGQDEDEQGVPFVGRAGQLLRQELSRVGWTRDDYFICNMLKCRPPGNRDPEQSEMANCRSYLDAQLAMIRPLLLITLGRISMNELISPKLKITRDHGQMFRKKGIVCLPMFHPAFVLRRQNHEEFAADFDRAAHVLKQLREQADG